MAGSYLEQFVESIQSLPCDLARNLRLIRCLDTRVQDFVVSAENLSNKYVKDANQLTSTEKNDFYQNIMDYMNKAQHLTDEKKELAHQIYNIVDKHIRRLDNELAKFDIELDNNGYNDDHSQTNHSNHNSTNGKDHSDHNSHQTNSSSSNTHHTPSNRKNKRSKSSASHSTSTPLPSTTSASLATSSLATTASATSTSAKETSISLKQSSAQKNDNSDSDNVKKRPASNNVEQTNGITNGIANNNSSMSKGKLVTSNGIMDMEVDPNEPLYCHCHQVSYGEMVGCDDPDCQIEWFHFSCVGLTSKPKGKWYCQNCQEKRKK